MKPPVPSRSRVVSSFSDLYKGVQEQIASQKMGCGTQAIAHAQQNFPQFARYQSTSTIFSHLVQQSIRPSGVNFAIFPSKDKKQTLTCLRIRKSKFQLYYAIYLIISVSYELKKVNFKHFVKFVCSGPQTNLLSIKESWIFKYRYSVFERRFKKKSKRKFLHQFSTIKRKKAIQDLPLINLSLIQVIRNIES